MNPLASCRENITNRTEMHWYYLRSAFPLACSHFTSESNQNTHESSTWRTTSPAARVAMFLSWSNSGMAAMSSSTEGVFLSTPSWSMAAFSGLACFHSAKVLCHASYLRFRERMVRVDEAMPKTIRMNRRKGTVYVFLLSSKTACVSSAATQNNLATHVNEDCFV